VVGEVFGELEDIVGALNSSSNEVALLIAWNCSQNSFTEETQGPLASSHNFLHVIPISMVIIKFVPPSHQGLGISSIVGGSLDD
jgi:hypothetical protein